MALFEDANISKAHTPLIMSLAHKRTHYLLLYISTERCMNCREIHEEFSEREINLKKEAKNRS